jgi:hypothetical protein
VYHVQTSIALGGGNTTNLIEIAASNGGLIYIAQNFSRRNDDGESLQELGG